MGSAAKTADVLARYLLVTYSFLADDITNISCSQFFSSFFFFLLNEVFLDTKKFVDKMFAVLQDGSYVPKREPSPIPEEVVKERVTKREEVKKKERETAETKVRFSVFWFSQSRKKNAIA